MKLSPICGQIIGAAIEVHRQLGPGLFESVYQQCLADELTELGLDIKQEKVIPVSYKGRGLGCGFRADLIVERQVLLELKSVDQTLPIHKSQVLTYMKLAEIEIGMLINFNVSKLVDGVRTFYGIRYTR